VNKVFTLGNLEKLLGPGVVLLKNDGLEHSSGCPSSECPNDCDCEDRCDGCTGDTDSCGEGGCPIG